MTYQEIFLKKLAEKWFDEMSVFQSTPITPQDIAQFQLNAAREAFEEFKKGEDGFNPKAYFCTFHDCYLSEHPSRTTDCVFVSPLDKQHPDCICPAHAEEKEEHKRWRAEIGKEVYFYFTEDLAGLWFISKTADMDRICDQSRWKNGNYFQTESQCLEALKKIKQVLSKQ